MAGSYSLLGSYVDPGFTSGTRTLKLHMSGTTIQVYIDGSLQISATDSAVAAAGKAGVGFYGGIANNGYHGDNFSASDYVPPGLPPGYAQQAVPFMNNMRI